MLQHLALFFEYLDFSFWWAMLASWITVICVIGLISYISNLIAKRYILTLFNHLVEKRQFELGKAIVRHQLLHRLSHIVPAMIIYFAIPWIIIDGKPGTASLVHVIQVALKIYMVVIMTLVLNSFANLVEEYYRRLPIAKQRPIKSYIEVLKIILFILAAILIGSILLNKSPAVLLTGLGAATAVLSLLFKDSLLGFMASIHMASYDLVRIGDWIEVPAYGADGEVLDISLNTVKVQNWDKTVVTIPTHVLTNTQMKNWRGMLDAGGRRMKRHLKIDMHTIRFLNDEMMQKIKSLPNTQEYIDAIEDNKNTTNISLFRRYIEYFLRNHPEIRRDMIMFARQLQPDSEGLPLEIYGFIQHTSIYEYENTQAEIFDHLLAVLPYFGLKIYQNATN